MALMPVEEALARVLDGAEPLPAEFIAVAAAHERVLADDLVARRTQPAAAVSSMDGYAVRAADVAMTPTTLKLVGEAAAGHVFANAIGPRETARIFTGGVLPAGADTVVIQENTRPDGDAIVVDKGERAGRYVRAAGLDFKEGDCLLRRGRQLTVRDLALASAMNHAIVPVHRRPRVAVISTGDELVPPGAPIGPGQIVSSNGASLAAMARTEGAQVLDLGIVPDRLEDTIAAVRQARDWGADILVTSGGASVGDYDLVQPALAAEGMQLDFWKVAMRPGKPLMHGRLGAMRVLAVPGNPVSAYVVALVLLVPLVRRLSGHPDISVPEDTANLGRDLPENDERQDYLRSTLNEALHLDLPPVATPLDFQDSSMMSGLARAQCLVIRPPHAPPARTGDTCRIIRLTL